METTKALIIGFSIVATMAAQAQNLADVSMVKHPRIAEESRKALNFRMVETNYLANLNSVVPGVVESALGHVTLMRIAYPNQTLRRLQEKLYDLASRGATPSIRYKAFIAMQVFANPVAFKELIAGREYSGDGLIEEISARQ